MPRYLIERTFPEGLQIPQNEEGAQICLTVVTNNTDDLVTWVQSYVTQDKSKTYCIYDAPRPRQSGGRHDGTTCRWTRSSKSRSSIPISIGNPRGRGDR